MTRRYDAVYAEHGYPIHRWLCVEFQGLVFSHDGVEERRLRIVAGARSS